MLYVYIASIGNISSDVWLKESNSLYTSREMKENLIRVEGIHTYIETHTHPNAYVYIFTYTFIYTFQQTWKNWYYIPQKFQFAYIKHRIIWKKKERKTQEWQYLTSTYKY